MEIKLQPASRKEVAYIAKGTAAFTALLIAVFAVLAVIGLYPFSYTIITGAAGGTAVAVLNFALMCLMVQNVAGLDDKKEIKKRVQTSYTRRLFLQGVWALIAYIAPCFHVVAAILPLFFPKLVILYRKNHYAAQPSTNPTLGQKHSAPPESDEDDDD